MKTYSILRVAEDEFLSRLTLPGRTLDLGGHKGSSYFSKLKAERPVEVANFDSQTPGVHRQPSGAEHVFDFEKPFPLPDQSFDSVLCINVLEHVYHYQRVVSEIHRILKPGGTLYLSVPFFFNIHGSPHDYFRYTEQALRRILTEAGFREVEVVVVGEGPCSAVFQAFGGSLPTLTLKLAARRLALTIDRFCSRHSARYAQIRTRVPLGYCVSASV
jgi:SAM-dependent methyltransferase